MLAQPDVTITLSMLVPAGSHAAVVLHFAGRDSHPLSKQSDNMQEFDAYIQDALLNPAHSPEQRRQLLVDWEKVRSVLYHGCLQCM